MDIINDSVKYYNEILEIAYKKYCAELAHHTLLTKKSKSSFSNFFEPNYNSMKCIVATENDICKGFILYSLRDEENEVDCNIPAWGYGSNDNESEKTISYLFVYLAEQIVTDKDTNFSIHLYAHDNEIQKLFSYMQFGIIAERTVRRINKIEHNSSISVRKISKKELTQKWSDIWALLKKLIDHLKKSPVFYTCNEFTENVYRDFLSDDETTVYIAEDRDKIIGLIESNPDNYNLLFTDSKSINVGEAFVLPEYRGFHVAQALLSCLENDLIAQEIEFDWVEHGTANPNARGFWNKYFETVEYEFIRSISCLHQTK